MNKRIRELLEQSGVKYVVVPDDTVYERFAELIVEEFRAVLADEYRKTPLECCGHFIRADEAIAQHFYGVQE